METERDELGYAGSKGKLFAAFIILLMAAVLIGYSTLYFFPDLANWLKKGVDADKIIWQVEMGK